MKRIALRHTSQQRIGVSQQQQSIGFGFRPTLIIGGSGGVGGLISTIKVNGEKKNLTTEPVVRPIEGGYNIEFNNQDVSIKT